MQDREPNTLEQIEPAEAAVVSQSAGHPAGPANIYPWHSSSRSPVDVLLAVNGESRRGPGVRLVAGVAIAVFGLGWVGGANWHRLSDVAAVFDPPARKITYSERIPDAETKSARTDGPTRKPASAAALQGAPVVTAASSRTAPVVQANVNFPTASTPAREMMAPVPETRPMTIEGWTIREVRGATAILDGPDGVWTVARGDTVPAVGRVDSIVRWGNRWIVATDGGLIATR